LENIAILTSWNSACGLSEYSKFLREGFEKLNIKVTIFGNFSSCYVYENTLKDKNFVPFCWMGYLDNKISYDLSILSSELILREIKNVLINYQGSLWTDFILLEIIKLLKKLNIKTGICFHDKCLNFSNNIFDDIYKIKTREDLYGDYIIPHGIKERCPVVCSVGMGRNDDNILKNICQRNNFEYRTFYGEKKNWKTDDELHFLIRNCDVVCLFYPENDMAGQSLAVFQALAGRRYIIVSDTSWFKDIQANNFNIFKVKNEIELENILNKIFKNNYFTWEDVCKKYIKIFDGEN
jgi:hypothetical protein